MAVKKKARKKAKKKKQVPTEVKKKAVKKKAQRKAKKNRKYALRNHPSAEEIGDFVSSERGLSANFPSRTGARRG